MIYHSRFKVFVRTFCFGTYFSCNDGEGLKLYITQTQNSCVNIVNEFTEYTKKISLKTWKIFSTISILKMKIASGYERKYLVVLCCLVGRREISAGRMLPRWPQRNYWWSYVASLATEKLLVVVCCRIGLTEITGARMLPR
jgi:hypothetical protein